MPNIAKVLKEEISRISRKEIKGAVAKVHKPTVRLKKDTVDLKRRVALLEKNTAELRKLLAGASAAQPQAAPAAGMDAARITAKGMRSLRRKLGLSRADFARLLAVTDQTVYNWENSERGALKLREATKAAILAVRTIGVREAQARLAELKQSKAGKKPAKTTRPASKRRAKK